MKDDRVNILLVDDQPDEVARRIGEFLNLPVDLPR